MKPNLLKSRSSLKIRFHEQLQIQLKRIRFILDYIIAESEKNSRFFYIGFLTVFIIALFLGLIQTILNRSAVIFIKLSENSVGQFDLALYPASSNSSQAFTINYTAITERLATKNLPLLEGTAPRWIIPASASSPSKGLVDSKDILAIVINEVVEDNIGIGTGWPYRALGYGETSISASVLRSLQIQPNNGESISLTFTISSLLSTVGVDTSFITDLSSNSTLSTNATLLSNFQTSSSSSSPIAVTVVVPKSRVQTLGLPLVVFFNSNFPKDANGDYIVNLSALLNLSNALSTPFTFQFAVVDAIEQPFGKYPSVFGNVAILDYNYAQTLVNQIISSTFSSPALVLASNLLGVTGTQGILSNTSISINLNDYCMTVILVMKNRDATYIKNDQDRKTDLVNFSNQVSNAIGLDLPVYYLDVLNQALLGTSFIQIFLGEIFFTVVAVLSALAVILIYSLLLSNVEDKTYEYGLLI